MVVKEKGFDHGMVVKEKGVWSWDDLKIGTNGYPNPSVYKTFQKVSKMFYKSFQQRYVDAISTRETI